MGAYSKAVRDEAADACAIMASDRAQHQRTGGSTSYFEIPGLSREARYLAVCAHMSAPLHTDDRGNALHHLEYAEAEAMIREGWPDGVDDSEMARLAKVACWSAP